MDDSRLKGQEIDRAQVTKIVQYCFVIKAPNNQSFGLKAVCTVTGKLYREIIGPQDQKFPGKLIHLGFRVKVLGCGV